MKRKDNSKAWKTVEISTIVSSVRTLNPLRSGEDDFIYIDLSAVSQGEKKITGERSVASSDAPSRARQVVNEGDVLVSTVRPNLNGVALVPAKLHGAIASTGFCVLRAKKELLDDGFLFNWVKSPVFISEMVKKATGASYPAVSDRIIFDSSIPLPPLAEQKRIAAILDQADALRADRRTTLTRLDELTQSIFLDMFGDPATNPKGWKLALMADLFEKYPIFGTMIPPKVDGGDWLSLRVANIQDWCLDLSDKKFVDLSEKEIERFAVKDGDLLMARAIASQEHLGKAVVAHPGEEKWAFDSHIMRLRFSKSKVLPEIIRNLLLSPGGRSIFLKASRRTAVQFNINTGEISNLKIPHPPLALQLEFARRVEAVEKLKAEQREHLGRLDELFVSLQHRAFRGEL